MKETATQNIPPHMLLVCTRVRRARTSSDDAGGVLGRGNREGGEDDGFSMERAVSDALATVQSSSPSCE